MSYSILSSNIVFGVEGVPQYSFVTPSDGILQLERLDGNLAVMKIDGRVLADTLQLSAPTRNRVVSTDAFGRLAETTVQVDAFQIHGSRIANLEADASDLGNSIEQLNVQHIIHNTSNGPALSVQQDGDETILVIKDDANTVMSIYDGGHTVMAPGSSTTLNGLTTVPAVFTGATLGVIGNVLSTGYVLGNVIGNVQSTTITSTDISVSNTVTTGSLAVSANMTALNGFFQGDLFIAASDSRLKDDIREISGALDIIKSIKGYTFIWREGVDGLRLSGRDIGLLAQEIQATPMGNLLVAPAPFDYNPGGGSRSGENYLTVRYDKLHALEIQSINDLLQRVEALESRK